MDPRLKRSHEGAARVRPFQPRVIIFGCRTNDHNGGVTHDVYVRISWNANFYFSSVRLTYSGQLMSVNVTVQYCSHVTVQYFWLLNRRQNIEPSTTNAVQHSTMVNIVWQCFDQSAKQLIVDHTTDNYNAMMTTNVHHAAQNALSPITSWATPKKLT